MKSRAKSEREKEVEKCLGELNGVLASDGRCDMVTAERYLKMSEMLAAGKFFGSGLEEMRKVVRKTDGLSRV